MEARHPELFVANSRRSLERLIAQSEFRGIQEERAKAEIVEATDRYLLDAEKGYAALKKATKSWPFKELQQGREIGFRLKRWCSACSDARGVDLGLVCALASPELKVFEDKKVLTTYDEITLGEVSPWRLGEFVDPEVTDLPPVRVVAACQQKMGMVDAALLTTQMIANWRPKVIAMAGICGGDPDSDLGLGDVLVPHTVCSYQTGKDTNRGFKTETRQEPVYGKTRVNDPWQLIMDRKDQIRDRIARDCVEQKMEWEKPAIETDPLACGDAVINKKGGMEEIKEATSNRKVVGVDMESYGVVRCVNQLQEKSDYQPQSLIVKSVSDFTEEKDERSDQPLAAFTSAKFLYYLTLDPKFRQLMQY